MKLWLLRPVENLAERADPWAAPWDKAFGFVVRAASEEEARRLALADAGDEASDWGGWRNHVAGCPPGAAAWLSRDFSTCVELVPDGEPAIIIREFTAG